MSLFGRKLSLTRSNSDAHKHTYCIYESRSASPIKASLYFIINEQNGDLRIKKSVDKTNFGSQTNLKYMNNIKNVNIIIESLECFVDNNNNFINNSSVRLIIQFNNALNIGNKKTKKGKYWDILFTTQRIRAECIKLLHKTNMKLTGTKLIIRQEKMYRPIKWISDNKVKKCQICLDNFNAVNRKHHCRKCGKVLCQKCSSNTAVLPLLGIRDIVRVCDICYKYIILNRMKCNGILTNDDLYYIDYKIYMNENDNDAIDNDLEYYYGINKQWRKFIAHNYCNDKLDPFNDELKELIKNGIPSIIRGYMWKNMISFECLNDYKNNYNFEHENLNETEQKQEYKNDLTMEKDLERTFPIHITYKNIKSVNKLRNILIKYSNRNNKIGYCQSMNFLGAIILLFMNENDSFWMLSYIMEKICCLFDEYYYHQTDIIGVKIDGFVFNDIIKQYLPNLYQHLININGNKHKNNNVNMINNLTFHWFLSLFINTLSFKSLLIIWDNMICYDNINIIFRAALSILKIKTQQLLKCTQFHEMHNILSNKYLLKDKKIQNQSYFIKQCYNNDFKDIENVILKQRIFHKNKLNDDYIESILYNDIEINLIANYSPPVTPREKKSKHKTNNEQNNFSKKQFISLNTPRRSLSHKANSITNTNNKNKNNKPKNLNNYYFQDDNDSGQDDNSNFNYNLFESSPSPFIKSRSKSCKDDDMITYNNGIDSEFKSQLLISKSFHRDVKNNDNMVMVASPNNTKTLLTYDDYIHISTDNN